MGFYLFNIGGAAFSALLVALISAMFLGFLTLDPLSLRIKMLAAGECKVGRCVCNLASGETRILPTEDLSRSRAVLPPHLGACAFKN